MTCSVPKNTSTLKKKGLKVNIVHFLVGTGIFGNLRCLAKCSSLKRLFRRLFAVWFRRRRYSLKSIATVWPSLPGSLRETSISKRSAARGFVVFYIFCLQRWVVQELWRCGLVLLAPQTNVERLHAFDDGSDSSCMFECAAYVRTKFADIFSLGFTKQLFCKINQMLIRNT